MVYLVGRNSSTTPPKEVDLGLCAGGEAFAMDPGRAQPHLQHSPASSGAVAAEIISSTEGESCVQQRTTQSLREIQPSQLCFSMERSPGQNWSGFPQQMGVTEERNWNKQQQQQKKPFVEDFIITNKRFIFMELFKNHEIENKPALDVGWSYIGNININIANCGKHEIK